mmetsp:Transcript_58446/g.126957  ORF Transcript_58446/g.126957 Transcript_58446/m.126957 type:complete len:200 (+) Transcript_58446:923-1522(+)
MDSFFSARFAPRPTQMKILEPTSTRNTSFVSSWGFFSLPSSSATGSKVTDPLASEILNSLGAEWVLASSAGPGSVISTKPPSAVQNSALRGSSSMNTISGLPPLSWSLMRLATSRPFIFSMRFASLPFHRKTLLAVSRMNTSPVLSDDAAQGTSQERTVRLPFTWMRRVVYASRSTARNPESTPPGRYSTPSLKSSRKP